MTIVFGPNLQVPYRVFSLAGSYRLSFYLTLLIKRFRSRRRRRFFQRQGGANGRIGKVFGDSFHFCPS